MQFFNFIDEVNIGSKRHWHKENCGKLKIDIGG